MTLSTGVDTPPVTEALAVGTTTVKLVIGQLTFDLEPVVPGGFYNLRRQLIREREVQEGLLKHYRGKTSWDEGDVPLLPGAIEAVSSRILVLNTLIRQTLDPSTPVPAQLVIGE
jgi:hypothetical protein